LGGVGVDEEAVCEVRVTHGHRMPLPDDQLDAELCKGVLGKVLLHLLERHLRIYRHLRCV
jgi:hypothetical protein